MRLIDLDPQWLLKDGARVGFTFRCPTKPEWRMSCFVVATPTKQQWELFERDFGEDWPIQGCNPKCAWSIEGGIERANFESLTLRPSLDGSAGGTWHGFITRGEIVGGI